MFDSESRMVKNCLLLIDKEKMTRDDIPDVSNLREVVMYELTKKDKASH